VVAWKDRGAAIENPNERESEEKDNAETQNALRKRREEKIQELLETERGPLPLPQLFEAGAGDAGFHRADVARRVAGELGRADRSGGGSV